METIQGILTYQDKCNQLGYPTQPQVVWQVIVVIGAFLNALMAGKTIYDISTANGNEKRKNEVKKLPSLLISILGVYILWNAVHTCNLYSRLYPILFAWSVQIVLQMLISFVV